MDGVWAQDYVYIIHGVEKSGEDSAIVLYVRTSLILSALVTLPGNK